MRCCLPSLRPAAFPPTSPPPIAVGFVRCFNGTTQPSDSSSVPRQLRLLDFLSRPGIAQATAGQTRSPRFRRDPSVRDVASDPGRATVPRITAPHMLPSAVATASAPAISRFRGSIPHPKRSLCTLRRGRHLPRRNTRYRAGATPFPDRTFTGWTAPASPGAPLLLHRAGLSPTTPCRYPGAPRRALWALLRACECFVVILDLVVWMMPSTSCALDRPGGRDDGGVFVRGAGRSAGNRRRRVAGCHDCVSRSAASLGGRLWQSMI
jgi:hypothetical protein